MKEDVPPNSGDVCLLWSGQWAHDSPANSTFRESGGYLVEDSAIEAAPTPIIYFTHERRAAIVQAVEAERSRIAGDRTPTAEPLTELGRDLKKQTGVPTILVDRIVGHVAATNLKDVKRHGKPN